MKQVPNAKGGKVRTEGKVKKCITLLLTFPLISIFVTVTIILSITSSVVPPVSAEGWPYGDEWSTEGGITISTPLKDLVDVITGKITFKEFIKGADLSVGVVGNYSHNEYVNGRVGLSYSISEALSVGSWSAGFGVNAGVQATITEYSWDGFKGYVSTETSFSFMPSEKKLELSTTVNTTINKADIEMLKVDWIKLKVDWSFLKSKENSQVLEIHGNVIFGDPSNLKLPEIFSGKISGSLTTEEEIPDVYVSTMMTCEVNENDPTLMSFTGTSGFTAPPVGGIVTPVNKLVLLVPWIVLAVLITVVTISVAVYWRRR